MLTYCTDLPAILRKSRPPFHFVAAGAQVTLAASASIMGLITPHFTNPSSAASRRRMDILSRFAIAMSLQQVMLHQVGVVSPKMPSWVNGLMAKH